MEPESLAQRSRAPTETDLPLEEVRRRILAELAPVSGSERVPLATSLGRVLAEDVHAAVDVPPHDNAAMDGYAVRSADLPAEGAAELQLAGRVLAGERREAELPPGHGVRIMTGAPLPPGADAVVIQERAELVGEAHVRLPGGVGPGENVRRAGEDIAAGAVALGAGCRLRPQEVGVIGSVGRAEVTVHRRPLVVFFATGDELRSPGEALAPGQIYDSNRPMIVAALRRLGVEVQDLGVVGDDPATLEATLHQVGGYADAVITTGGVSVGEADHVKPALEAVGDVAFWRVAVRPGRPLAFGWVGQAAFFGLPGNPVSAAVSLYKLVQPGLRRMMGERGDLAPVRIPALTAEPLRKRPGRAEFQRGILEHGADGVARVVSTGSQGSGVLTSLVHANCLIYLEADRGDVGAGETVHVQPLEGVQL